VLFHQDGPDLFANPTHFPASRLAFTGQSRYYFYTMQVQLVRTTDTKYGNENGLCSYLSEIALSENVRVANTRGMAKYVCVYIFSGMCCRSVVSAAVDSAIRSWRVLPTQVNCCVVTHSQSMNNNFLLYANSEYNVS
jgi:hypothetical protein